MDRQGEVVCGKSSYLASLSSRRFLNSSEADEGGPRLSGVWRVFRPQCCWSPARNEAGDLQNSAEIRLKSNKSYNWNCLGNFCKAIDGSCEWLSNTDRKEY
ncbi:hypothetical protein E2C01_022195 [Portunus trituberculatus]|uniref:Uncharacterized protein n=1 Tax=Portunus trituberculatus TaxID=210409 RepID=A0A5B7E4R1_PORTR|nr:hypothetical protein [Portunus trituberculatus]